MDRRNRPIINYYLEQPDQLTEYVFDFLADCLGLNLVKTDQIDEAKLYYGNSDHSAQLAIPLSANDRIWEKQNVANAAPAANLPFDLINAIGFFLSDAPHQNLSDEQMDRHERLKFEASFQFQHQIHTIPIVNQYVQYFAKCIETTLGLKPLPLYPDGKKACVLLSHDVDNPGKYDEIFTFTLFPKKKTPKGFFDHYRFFFGTLKNWLFDKEKNENWNFDAILEAEQKHQFTSTFFFATTYRQQNEGHPLDVPYNLDTTKYKKVLQQLAQSDHSIGLHAGYKAYQSAATFKGEKDTIERILGTEIKGLRHHYWHMGKDIDATLLLHEKLGFAYDSSLAFNDHIGFRYNVALPFKPFLAREQRAVEVLQIPVFCMDGNLFYQKGMKSDMALGQIMNAIETLVNHNGVGSLDWHVNTSYPGGDTFREWGVTYLKVLAYLSTRNDIWVTDLDQFYTWWTNERYAQ